MKVEEIAFELIDELQRCISELSSEALYISRTDASVLGVINAVLNRLKGEVLPRFEERMIRSCEE